MNKPKLPNWFLECAVGVFLAITVLAPFFVFLSIEYHP